MSLLGVKRPSVYDTLVRISHSVMRRYISDFSNALSSSSFRAWYLVDLSRHLSELLNSGRISIATTGTRQIH